MSNQEWDINDLVELINENITQAQNEFKSPNILQEDIQKFLAAWDSDCKLMSKLSDELKVKLEAVYQKSQEYLSAIQITTENIKDEDVKNRGKGKNLELKEKWTDEYKKVKDRTDILVQLNSKAQDCQKVIEIALLRYRLEQAIKEIQKISQESDELFDILEKLSREQENIIFTSSTITFPILDDFIK